MCTENKMGTDSLNKVDISVIVPALNEEANILTAINSITRNFEEYEINGEIIVINDGSTDGTEQLVRDIIKKDEHIKLINHEEPRGLGASFWDGVDYARGDVVVLLPGDNENEPREIFRYYELLEHVDFIIPFVFNREVRSFFRNALSFIYRFIINTTFIVNFNYTNGTVLYRKSVLKKLDSRSNGFFFQTDIIIRLAKKNYLFAEVPYKLKEKGEGKSEAISFPSLQQVVRGYLLLVKDYYFKKDKRTLVLLARDSLTFTRRRKKKLLKSNKSIPRDIPRVIDIHSSKLAHEKLTEIPVSVNGTETDNNCV